ncbi:chitinase [Basidiobolus meristosporus CBS 931.73]|uniref:Chitinase n=1 Tax=Basidiobolus meristosporus CBS 931.73 TaxID=1314790 RepID=A0A1Y1X717_9FUNG|nr:chitinase [Basidiobolus meristosporus CBS 931.73]|eukprot:ORX81583.1 chitinase [Basidiobolus meristosporus CBS 931.73]
MKVTGIHLLTLSAAIVLTTVSLPLVLADDDKVIVGYYAPWGNVRPSQLSFDKVTHINYYPEYDGDAINQLKQLATSKGVKIQISLGGWTGSQTFSLMARDPLLRQKFINNALVFVRKNTKPDGQVPSGWDLDGIDIDWEYPGRKGVVCNVYNAADTENYLNLLKELRTALDKEFPSEHKLLTAAVRVQPFDGPNGKPLKDVSEFAAYLDFINVMAYDLCGNATTGPNAPFNYDPKGQKKYSFRQAASAWLAANWPADKLVMGLPFYGRSATATVDMNTNPSNQFVAKSPVVPKGDPSDTNTPNKLCNEGAVYSGQWTWRYLRSEILRDGPASPIHGWRRYWDNITQTPWLFHSISKMYISYDDPHSLKVKADYSKQQGFRGLMFWDMADDSNDELLNSIQKIR